MPAPGFAAFGGLKDKVSGKFGSNIQYEEFELPKHAKGLEAEGGGMAGVGGGGLVDDVSTPESLPSPERPPLRHIDKYIRPECPCLSKRMTVAVLTCMGFIIMFGMRCNMGMAKLRSDKGHVNFNWTVGTASAIDSSIFWGYLVTQVPGGFLAAKYPANLIFGTAIGCSSLLHLLVPMAMQYNATILIMIRVLQGLVEGFTYPACHGIWRFWAPPLERSRLATLAFCGTYAGVFFGMPLSGILISWIAWQAPFYFYSVLGIIWYASWLWLTFEKPAKHPTISARELLYIEQSLGTSTQTTMPTLKTTPWKAFFTSMPVYAIIVANFCRSWNFYLLVLFQASYMQSTFGLQTEETGLVGSLPHLLMTIIVPCGGLLADHLRSKEIMTTTTVRKLFNCGGFGMEAVFFLVVAYAKSATQATLALTFGVAFSGFAISGFNVNHLDIAPRYASILMGMSNGIGTIAGLFCPIVVDHLTEKKDRESWKIVFILAAIIHFSGVIFYGIFASGELQPWAEPVTSKEEKPWNPFDDAFQGHSLKQSPSQNEKPELQHQLSGNGKAINYGATEHVAGNPFVYSNQVSEETVQPTAHDTYMHGNVEDRTY